MSIYVSVALIVAALVFSIIISGYEKRPKKVLVPDVRANVTIDSYNSRLQRMQDATYNFNLALNEKQRFIILSNDGVSYQKCIYLVEEFNKESEVLESRLKNVQDYINIRAFDSADSILSDLDDDIKYLEGLTRSLKSIKVEKDSFKTVFQPTMEPQNAVSYFDGCNTREDLITRYKALSKVFHPDSKAGSKELFQEIQKQYNKKLKSLPET